MKVIYEETPRQTRRYGDSYGYILIEIEPGDDVDKIIEEYTSMNEDKWYARHYKNPRRLSKYYVGDKEVPADVLELTSVEAYLD